MPLLVPIAMVLPCYLDLLAGPIIEEGNILTLLVQSKPVTVSPSLDVRPSG